MTMQGLTDWLRHRRERAELQGLPREEVGRIAHDLGVSACELEQMVERGHEPAQLEGMLNAVGLDGAELARAEPALLRDMQRICSACQAVQECRSEVAAGTAMHNYGDFCINAPTLDALKAAARA